MLEPLDADGVRRDRRLLRAARRRDPRRRGCWTPAAACPAGSTRPPASGRGARPRGGSTRQPTAQHPAAPRRARSKPTWPAASPSYRSSASDSLPQDERAPVTCPYKGLATFDADDAGLLLRARAARRRAGRAPCRRAAARGRRPVRERQVLRGQGRPAARAGGRRPARQPQLDAGADPARRAAAARAATRDAPARPRATRHACGRPVRGAVHCLPRRGRARASSSTRSCALPAARRSSCSRCAPTSTAAAPPTPSCRACSAPITCWSAR